MLQVGVVGRIVSEGRCLTPTTTERLIENGQLNRECTAHLALRVVEVILDPRGERGSPIRLVLIASLVDEAKSFPTHRRSPGRVESVHHASHSELETPHEALFP
jgi:hypothetical protein